MNHDETTRVLAVICSVYPNFYKCMTQQQTEEMINAWALMFDAESYAVVNGAISMYIANDKKGYPPPIGAIKDCIAKLTEPNTMTEGEAWEEIRQALTNSSYNAQQEYEKLSPLVKQIVGSPSQLHMWARMNEDDLNTVVSSNFMRSYRAKQQNFREYQALPEAMKKTFEALSANMDIGSYKALEEHSNDV